MGEIKHGIAWSEEYELGNKKVDDQHYHLFELLSDLIGACLEGEGVDKVQETLNFLVNYTVQHFNDEEILQLQYKYPDYTRHKQLHEDFKATVGALVKKFKESGSSEELSSDVNKIVVHWLVKHIKQEDKRIGVHIRNSVT